MSDKIKRFISLSNSGIQLVNNESLRDTLIDLHNYSAMAIMLMDEKNLKDGEIVEEAGPFPIISDEQKKWMEQQDKKIIFGTAGVRDQLENATLTKYKEMTQKDFDMVEEVLKNESFS